MKSGFKPKSITTDTRLSHSHVLNTSSLNNTHIQQAFESKENRFANHIKNSENKEVQYLRHKNKQLEERVKRMTNQIKDLEDNKNELLKLNRDYVNVMNRYYENCNKKREKRKSEEGKMLDGLERDHRNLVRHCLVMEGQIKNYTVEMEKFEQQKRKLRRANHTDVSELLEELLDLSADNRQLKKQNNKLTYDLQRARLECRKMGKAHEQMEEQAGNNGEEVDKMRSYVNTMKQESLDRSNAYQARIYQLEVKVEKLQQQLRRQQDLVYRQNTHKRALAIREVQYVHEKSKLEKSLADLLNPQGKVTSKRANLNRSVNYNQKKNIKRQSLLGKSFDIS